MAPFSRIRHRLCKTQFSQHLLTQKSLVLHLLTHHILNLIPRSSHLTTMLLNPNTTHPIITTTPQMSQILLPSLPTSLHIRVTPIAHQTAQTSTCRAKVFPLHLVLSISPPLESVLRNHITITMQPQITLQSAVQDCRSAIRQICLAFTSPQHPPIPQPFRQCQMRLPVIRDMLLSLHRPPSCITARLVSGSRH